MSMNYKILVLSLFFLSGIASFGVVFAEDVWTNGTMGNNGSAESNYVDENTTNTSPDYQWTSGQGDAGGSGTMGTVGDGTNNLVDPCVDDPFATTDCVNRGSGNTITNDGGELKNNGGEIISPGGSRELKNPLKSKSIEEFLLKIIDVLLVFALPIIVLYIMYAGYLFVTAQGDSGQISTARSALLWAVVGGVIVLGARVIVAVIQGTITAF